MLRFCAIAYFILAASCAWAQRSSIGSWYIYFGNQQLSKRWSWHNEVQYRNFNAVGDLEQLLLRTGLGYNLTPGNNNLLLGYAYIYSEPYTAGTESKGSVSEHRIFQQLITRQQFSRFYLQHRYRLEQRFIEDTDFRMRYRYFLSLNLPLTNREMVPNTVYLSVYNEIFIHNTSPLYDRNRLYGALGYTINKYLRAEVGFMSQLLENGHREQVQVVLFNNIPFIKD
ncbi:MAG: DUF2490 domain-containing protein [Hymenobacteraceae bacterium]|nr:DUF2490 domain-containing protein [Hymenobacteraceae bacterium]MDX5480207.1 DUF2490 domain-containing protein [Hymenobacteraceae bacterium]